jgi:hypothetical protein
MRTLFTLALPLLALACGNTPAPPPSAPPPPKPAETQAADAGTAKAASLPDIGAVTSAEAKSGTCDPVHQRAIEQLLARIHAGMSQKASDDGKPLGMTEVFHRVLPLAETARSVEISVKGRGTEVHVLAYGAKDLSLDVLAEKGAAATTMRSPFQRSSAADLSLEIPKHAPVKELASDSRQVNVKMGQPLVVRLTGEGCALLVAFLKPSV